MMQQPDPQVAGESCADFLNRSLHGSLDGMLLLAARFSDLPWPVFSSWCETLVLLLSLLVTLRVQNNRSTSIQ